MRYMNSCRFNPSILRFGLTFICLLWFGAVVTRAAPHYVVPTNNDSVATSPFETWAKAATNIQDAVSAAADGETVWITNGTYFCQGICTNITGTLTNTAMVMLTNAITVRSFSGQYSNTIVNGYYPAWMTRVFYLDNTGAVVSGLTITNGFSTSLSGVGTYMNIGGLLTNCLITGNILTNDAADTRLCAGIHMITGTVSHCIIRGNKALGTNSSCTQSAAINCTGGSGIITNCQISWNSIGKGTAYGYACRLYYSTYRMQGCVVHNNSAGTAITTGGGGIFVGWCAISNNSDLGVFVGEDSIMRNCLIVTNGRYGVSISQWGGTMVNCTIAGHTVNGFEADECVSGEKYAIENNIIYYNAVGSTLPGYGNWYSTNIFYTNCCTIPIPTNFLGQTMGTGNITNNPLFVNNNAGNWHLTASSSCINTGTNQTWMTNSCDLDGGVRIRYGKVDIGAYEYINKSTLYNFR